MIDLEIDLILLTREIINVSLMNHDTYFLWTKKKLNKNPLKTKENDFMRNLQFVKMLNLLL